VCSGCRRRHAGRQRRLIQQLVRVLRLELDMLYFRAGRIPLDIRSRSVSDERAAAACRAFRHELRKGEKNLRIFFTTVTCVGLRSSPRVFSPVLHLSMLAWQTTYKAT